MTSLENGWIKYWEERVSSDENYYGRGGRNSSKIISVLSIKKGDNVLDIGCANGAHLSDIRKKKGAICYGIDISPIAIKLNKDKKIKLKVADMEKTGYKSGIFDKVFSLGTFEHTPRTLRVFNELNRIMKIGGEAYISVPNKISLFHITKNVKMILGTWDLGYEKSFSPNEIRKIAHHTGFEVDSLWIEPHISPSNIFNKIDNLLNGLNNKRFGFFVNFILRKVKNVR
jgi:SAM-dependent methyltransferase